ncbi:MAG TPA: carboxypeptidase-like regulatory domain-containing protein [Thermoanaerobaculia bacterium]|nr:carboxypeptidase-like regulatory domain-containing protein [Thermoanaerobaculia bacterium]
MNRLWLPLIVLLAAAPAACKDSNTVTGPLTVTVTQTPTVTPTPLATFTVSGVVTADAPISGMLVSCSCREGALTTSNGSYTIQGVPPGTWDITTASTERYRPAHVQVTVPPDAAHVDLHLRPAS